MHNFFRATLCLDPAVRFLEVVGARFLWGGDSITKLSEKKRDKKEKLEACQSNEFTSKIRLAILQYHK
jgi:hypothetical protein